MPNGNDLSGEQAAPKAAGPFGSFLNPVVALAFTMLLAIVLLIGATVLGLDKGLLLTKMGKVDFARGLITYLFAVVTIGTAVVMVVSALTGPESPEHRRSFQRGKEILSLLLGVFGTIVGFYFGSEVAGNAQPAEEAIVKIVPLRLSSTSVLSGTDFTVFTYVTGGRAPLSIWRCLYQRGCKGRTAGRRERLDYKDHFSAEDCYHGSARYGVCGG